MSYRPQRTFNGTQGNPSTDTMGPEQLSHDIDELCKMFNPTSIHSDGSAGGVTADNLNFTGLDINEIGGVASGDIKAIRVKMNGDIEYTTDGETYHPAFAREANYLPLAGGIMSGTLNMNNNKITNLATPEAGSDPATKNYTDAIKTALETAIALKAPIASPTFTGNPTAPTPSTDDNSTQIATTAFTQAVAAGVAGNTYSKADADAKFETISNANKLVRDVSYNSETGTFTIVTQDGTTTTIDTNIEKIPVSVSIIQSGSTYKLRITNEDGSYSECDVSAMFNAITFVDSTEITFTETTNQDGSKNVTASIKPGSIVGSKLDPDYKDILDALVDRAETAETNAQNSADNAADSATAAAGSASAASGSASAAASSVTSASQYASAAEGFKNQASNSATAAASSATEAATSASNASTSAFNAATSEANAATSASNAATSASDAASDAQRTQELTNEAMEYATDAAGSQIDAETAARNAAASASTASTKASQAATSASNASTSETNAANSATAAAASAASVGTQASDAEAAARGTRNGVPVSSTDEFYNDNAKYYKDQAAAIVGPQQPKITATGILKGEGDGVVSAAVAGTDYQAPLPSQNGQSGKFLTTNGSALSWDSVDALPSQTGQSGKFLTTNGTTASWADNPPSDYDADEGEAGHILNRPFYTEVTESSAYGVKYFLGYSNEGESFIYAQFIQFGGYAEIAPDAYLSEADKKSLYDYFTNTPLATILSECYVNIRDANANVFSASVTNVESVTDGDTGNPAVRVHLADRASEGAIIQDSSVLYIQKYPDTFFPILYLYFTAEGEALYPEGTNCEAIISIYGTFPTQTVTVHQLDSKYIGSDIMRKGVDYVTAGQRSGITLGPRATAEGYYTTASGNYSHAEGNQTKASGSYSHSEGISTVASGMASHAEGNTTTASGNNSHAEGYYTTAQRKSQHVFGEYNVLETGSILTRGQYVEIVGNGTSSSARSNARTLDWSGNETLAGKLTLGAAPTANMDAATKGYVDTSIANIDALPDQTDEDGKFLMTDGSDASWASVEPEVFWVEVGGLSSNLFADKTLSEIWDAFVAGKLIIARYNSAQYRLISVDTSYGARFVAIIPQEGNGDDFYAELFCNTADVWSRRTVTIGTQMKITASGILKGDGAGGVTAAVAGTDYVKDYVTAGQKSGTTLGTKATAEGENNKAGGHYSHAEGSDTNASGNYSHAEGSSTIASQTCSHAEGIGTTASGYSSHAEGGNTTASGYTSHAEGAGTTASGYYSHAEGGGTTAQRRSQHVFGEYNVLDTTGSGVDIKGSYIEIVGKGTSNSSRSNARTLDWSGNEVLAGKLTVGAAPTADMDVATKQYVDATRTVAQGGTGATSFTANCVIMSGSSTTAALTTRAVTNNTATSGAVSANTNIPTMNTLRFAINRTTSVAAADTGYTTYMARGEALNSADTNPTINGAISWTYA